MVGGDDALDLDALFGDVVFELGDVGEEAGVLDHEAAAVVLDDEHLVVDEIVGLIGMQLRRAEIVDGSSSQCRARSWCTRSSSWWDSFPGGRPF